MTGTDLLPTRARRRTRIGLVAGGLGTYWPQFPGLLSRLQSSARYVAERFGEMNADVVDVGFVSDARDGAAAAERLRTADCDLIVLFLATYLTSSMVLPIAQRTNTPVLVLDLQPFERMDHDAFDTGDWLAYCGQCRCRSWATCSGALASASARCRATCARTRPGSASRAGSTQRTSAPRCGTPATA